MTSTLKHTLPSIDIVGASAGTGKTTRLATEFIEAVEGIKTGTPIDPTKILVCTFTCKAADELCARIRKQLLKSGNTDAAQLVLAGYVGTVNGICGRLLKDYAIESGYSPEQNVIPEHMQTALFEMASSDVLDAYAMRIDEIADRLSFDFGRKSRFGKNLHWTHHVREICALARANAMEPEMLRQSAQLSCDGMLQYFEQRDGSIDPDDMHQELFVALDKAVYELERTNDDTKVTADALETLRDCAGRAFHGPLRWADWTKLSKVKVASANRKIVEDVLRLTKNVTRHPQLHDDVREYIQNVFECAIDCLAAYQDYKAANGLVDFIDQEYLALALLDNPQVQESLRSRLEIALIDEFQDTSPIQLALFLKLANIVKHSIWVGDVKQAIYGFRGTDPGLMKRASELFNRQPPLEKSYRSRPELVNFSNEIFRRVFPTFGITEEDVVIRPSGKRAESERHTIEVWRCNGTNLEECYQSIAVAMQQMLADESIRIEDALTGNQRTLRGSDIAILSRKNDHCSKIAEALADSGMKVAMSRSGLLDTPECLLAISSLRFLLDKYDRVALGRIVHLMQDYATAKPEDWLEAWLKAGKNPEKILPHAEKFQELRSQLATCTASDALGLAISAGKVLDMVHGWGNVAQRLSNLDALRGIVTEYEDACAMARVAATARGFVIYLEQLEDSDQPPSADPDAIQLLTYHGSKGLEWPIVVLADLDAECNPKVHKDLCRVYVESSDDKFDIADPLRGRWIRFWPWPFGLQEKDGHFEIQAANSREFASTAHRLLAENTRLMYVGITRARDVLVFAPYIGRDKNPGGFQWLEELRCEAKSVIEIPEEGDNAIIRVGTSTHRAYLREFKSEDNLNKQIERKQTFAPPRPDFKIIKRAPYAVSPSSMTSPSPLPSSSTTIIDIGARIAINGNADMQTLGDCVHSFLAVDDINAPPDRRLANAKRICELWSVDQIAHEDFLEMSERLQKFLSTEFGADHIPYSECPVAARLGEQRLRGTIDLLIETQQALHIIDHKSFPGAMEKWADKAMSYLPQLEAYATALSQASEKPVGRLLIHMPIVGKIVELPFGANQQR
jgi:ATP-dependent helicase/nuclease subunit A